MPTGRAVRGQVLLVAVAEPGGICKGSGRLLLEELR